MLSVFLTSVMSFVGTNLDDIFLLTFFFAQAAQIKDTRRVIAGQYLGIGTLFVISVLTAYGLSFLPENYLCYLGVFPILLGIKVMVSRKEKNSDAHDARIGVFSVALVTISNGADNLGVYIPLFAGFSPWKIAFAAVVFVLMTALWCFLGKKLADLPFVRTILLRYQRVIVPTVFILLGAYILLCGFLGK